MSEITSQSQNPCTPSLTERSTQGGHEKIKHDFFEQQKIKHVNEVYSSALSFLTFSLVPFLFIFLFYSFVPYKIFLFLVCVLLYVFCFILFFSHYFSLLFCYTKSFSFIKQIQSLQISYRFYKICFIVKRSFKFYFIIYSYTSRKILTLCILVISTMKTSSVLSGVWRFLV